MSQAKLILGLFVALVFLVVASNTFFTVNEREQAFTLQFGRVVNIYETPGLKVKIPFVQEVIKYDRRLLDYNIPAIEVIAGDQKRMVIDLFTRYVISNPVKFYRTLTDEAGAKNRLSSIVPGSMRRVVGRIRLGDLLSEKRVAIMDRIHKEVQRATQGFGIDVKDVRIIRADLPKENSEAIFRRMESERKQEASLYRAEGHKLANEVRSKADREKAEIIATAKKEAETIRGSGEARAVEIFAQAFNEDRAFFDFWKSMQAYAISLEGDKTTLVLSPEGEFFRYFGKSARN
ncbi:MAG: protease modulator HflC [Pseudomonadota bacterium]